ncbi:lipoic acid synthetase [Neisseria animalis]|uniref:Lipoic acid synthetase n=1 Tax=Neisseria animalis TaxID=492 RepID=A0A5P3MUT1_NEIAN|nr:lipoic acid synthetase [Neisseria animalis]QEY24521.1 lipoic acid synthetase [Neisseria animalis]ROW33062.1 lipoic acid synthetase [Neisseria animalis]VEE07259.1 Uncharacterised protein [Neisseria animalis]
MWKISLAAVCCFGIGTACAAPVFECTDKSGRKLYTQEGGAHCVVSKLGRPSVYPSAVAPVRGGKVQADMAEQEQAAAMPSAKIETAQHELAQARSELEAGKQVRYGNERNYAKYLERIADLEGRVKAAEEKLNAAKEGRYSHLK